MNVSIEFISITFNVVPQTAIEPLAYVHLEDYHYSVVEGGDFEVCVVGQNHSPEELSFNVWIHIKGMTSNKLA